MNDKHIEQALDKLEKQTLVFLLARLLRASADYYYFTNTGKELSGYVPGWQTPTELTDAIADTRQTAGLPVLDELR